MVNVFAYKYETGMELTANQQEAKQNDPHGYELASIDDVRDWVDMCGEIFGDLVKVQEGIYRIIVDHIEGCIDYIAV